MKKTFVDSSYWIALLHEADSLHGRAESLAPEGRWITTLAIVLEVMDAFSVPRHRKLAEAFWQIVETEPRVTVIELAKNLLLQGMHLFRSRPDKSWSFTDCLSFVVMQNRGISEALTADHHFEQAGFRALLRIS